MKYFVADSYKNYIYDADKAFSKSGRLYVDAICECDKCSGKGTYYWGAIINGVPQYAGSCFKCDGTGYLHKEIRLYTEAEKDSMGRAKEKKQEKRIIEQNNRNLRKKLEFFAKNGFTENGKTYCIFGKDTFSFKDDFKAAGAKYNRELGWHISTPIEVAEGIHLIEIDFDDYYTWNFDAIFKSDAKDRLQAAMDIICPPVIEGEFVGKEKERLRDMAVKVVSVRGYDSIYGGGMIYCFKSTDGNFFTWFTTRDYGWEEGDECLLTGTVKKHEIYGGKRVTYLNRCMIREAE